ncbi:MAG: hypothetical protein Kow0042_15520 [Calditrichia bacterium]
MIEPNQIDTKNFKKIFTKLEETYIDELENLLISKLYQDKVVAIPGFENESIEFVGRTNYTIRLKRPNKNFWSISFQTLRKSIRKVLREGKLEPVDPTLLEKEDLQEFDEVAVSMLLHILPDNEYLSRSFVGNLVEHPTLGEGRVIRISESGNVEIEFGDRSVMLKPGFVQLKLN